MSNEVLKYYQGIKSKTFTKDLTKEDERQYMRFNALLTAFGLDCIIDKACLESGTDRSLFPQVKESITHDVNVNRISDKDMALKTVAVSLDAFASLIENGAIGGADKNAIKKTEGLQLAESMPDKSEDLIGQTFLYIGPDTTEFENSHGYRLEEPSEGVLEWVEVFSGGGGGSSYEGELLPVAAGESMPIARHDGSPLQPDDYAKGVYSDIPFTTPDGYEFENKGDTYVYTDKGWVLDESIKTIRQYVRIAQDAAESASQSASDAQDSETVVETLATETHDDKVAADAAKDQAEAYSEAARQAQVIADAASTAAQGHASDALIYKNQCVAIRQYVEGICQHGTIEEYNAKLIAGDIKDYTTFFVVEPK